MLSNGPYIMEHYFCRQTMSLPPSRLFDYTNRQELDATFANAFASDGSERAPRIPAELLFGPFRVFLDEVQEPIYAA